MRRVLVCGSRTYRDVAGLFRALDTLHAEEAFAVVIEGEARGADLLAKAWALDRRVPVEAYPADWTRYGKGAGHIRNAQMLTDGRPDLVVAFPDGALEDTKGTANMVRQAMTAGVEVQVVGPALTR